MLDKKLEKAAYEEIQKIKSNRRSINAGYSESGYNFGLGVYIRDKDHYKRVIREKKTADPFFQEHG